MAGNSKATRKATLRNKAGLHMRPAQMIVETAGRFLSDVEIGKAGEAKVNAKSFMDVIMQAAGQGVILEISAAGEDAAAAADALAELVERGFDEEL